MASESMSAGRASGGMTDETDHYYDHVVEVYELDSCVNWIKKHNFEKVCLQFPESLLVDSVDVASYIEHSLLQKVFIVGDTTFGSCCVDEVAASHVHGDALIHFGHSCLSPVSIPVYYVFLKKKLDIPTFLNLVEKKIETPGPILMMCDVGYSHILNSLRSAVVERPKLHKCVVIPELVLPHQEVENSICSKWCFLKSEEYNHHFNTMMQRAYCTPPGADFQTLIYIGEDSPPLYNISYFFKGAKVYYYTSKMEDLEEYCKSCVTKQLSYNVERIREAKNVGIIVATLGITGYKEAVEHAKTLCNLNLKKCYILSIGRISPTKIANFSEIDVFVAISCPESDYGDKKAYMQPIVGLYELDLALNKARPWSFGHTRDFREVLREAKSMGWKNFHKSSAITGFEMNMSMDENDSVTSDTMAKKATQASMNAPLDSSYSLLMNEYKTFDVQKVFNKKRTTNEIITVREDDVAFLEQSRLMNDMKNKSKTQDQKNADKLKESVKSDPRAKQTHLKEDKPNTSYGGARKSERPTYVEKKISDVQVSDSFTYPLVPKKVMDNLLAPPSNNSIQREWRGLEQNIGEDEPAKLKEGRKGGPQTSYNSEPK